MSGCKPPNAASSVAAETPLADASARSEATQEEKSARAGAAASASDKAAKKRERFHRAIIGDSWAGVEADSPLPLAGEGQGEGLSTDMERGEEALIRPLRGHLL